MDFGKENGTKLPPKWEPKSMLPLKRKNQLNTSPLVPNGVRRGQVGSKNSSKIDKKMRSTWEGILEPIFLGFWWVLEAKLGGKMKPRSMQKGIEKMTEKRQAVE